ncbi:MAG: YicC family protein [Chitinivibrionia bacterium]|nr:YicC family protein [Chitinivibrionia bacterium]
MLISMTGFGQSEVAIHPFRVSVEIRSVNHRFLDFSLKIPKALNIHEKDIKDIIKKELSRGRISVSIDIDAEHPESLLAINTPLMERYYTVLRDFARKHRLQSEVDINTLALLPDVFVKQNAETISEEQWPPVRNALVKALGACMAMRLAEGKAIEADLRKRLKRIAALIAQIEKLAPKALQANRKSLRERIDSLMAGAAIDNDRWMTEMSMLADRLDFTEEITRLKSHAAQFTECLNEGGAVSKKLTYILQEIHREVTTAGVKAASTKIVELVVFLKEESEKLREQVQNIE